ncbi:MAG: FGGY family carbohydrate kinase [Bryobacteraceae bacterium]
MWKTRAIAIWYLGPLICGLIWKLTGGRCNATDPSNASRTMLFNLRDGLWDPALTSIFDIPPRMLPAVMPSSGVFGECDAEHLGAAIPWRVSRGISRRHCSDRPVSAKGFPRTHTAQAVLRSSTPGATRRFRPISW